MNALVVADDLTGAMDTGHGFAARGRDVRVALAGPDDRNAAQADETDRDPARAGSDVLAVDTDSRDRDPETAATAVERAIAAHPADLVYKKVDSTLRGNVVAEADAALAATGADLAVVAPAFPAAGRTTVGGEHRVDGTPLAAAGYGVDESDLPTLLAASRYPVSHVGIDTVTAGEDAVGAALAAVGDRPALVACDAETADHLATVAAAARAVDADVLYVGSGGLARHVAVPGDSDGPAVDQATRDTSGTGVLGVVGSVNERTLAQLAAVPDEQVVALDPAAAVRDPERTGRDATAALAGTMADEGRAVVTAATGSEDVGRAERAAADLANGADPATRVATALGAAAAATVERGLPSGLVLTGGDTARAALGALDAPDLALTGDAVADGVPEGRVLTGPAAGTRVVTKAGGFGDRRTILNCLDAVSGV